MSELPAAEKINPNETEKFFTTPLILIFVIVFIDLIGFGMVIPVLPIYAQTAPFFANPFEIGLVVSIYSWMQFIFSPILGRLSDKYGRRPILFVSLLGSAAGYVLLGLANTLFLVFAGRIISGITGGNISAAQAYIADVTTKENRGKGMALFGAAFGLGFVLGPAIGGITSKYGVHVPFFIAAVLSLVAGSAVYLVLPETRKLGATPSEGEAGGRLAQLLGSLREPQFGTVSLIYFLLVTAFSIMTYAFVLYTAFRFNYNAEQNGYLFALVGLTAVIGQGLLFGTLVKRFGETRLVVFGCFLMALSFALIPFVTPAFAGAAGLVGVSIMLAFANSMASPSLNTLASKISHEHKQGTSLGIMQSGASLARAIGPLMGGVLLNNAANQIDESTLYRTFFVAAAIMLAAFLIAIYSVRLIGKHVTA
ncbi:MAG TPA: MFS transporter [Pyrinomonadaceae bacterium]|nr:MFS transporter [Pyrinomonadaceae bacterium]